MASHNIGIWQKIYLINFMLSIIIPALNEEKYLPQLIKSIKRQDFTDYEIIVSDANSEDATRDLATALGARVVVDGRRHPSFQRNTGAQNAQRDIILFLDADTVLPDNFLAPIVNEFERRNLDVAGFFLDFGSKKNIHRLCSFGYNTFAACRQYWRPISVGAGIMTRRHIHESIKGFDETLFVAEDYDYCTRAAKFGKFRILRSRRLPYSVRRMDKEGSLRVLLKWFKMGTRTMVGRNIKKEIIKYDFGKF